MTEQHSEAVSKVLLVAAIFVLMVVGIVAQGRCQDGAQTGSERQAGSERLTAQLALARVCASEIGFDGSVTECAAIAAVLRNRFNGNILAGAQAYSERVFNLDRRDSRAYIAYLRPDGREPEMWPAIIVRPNGAVRHAPWSAYRRQWLELYRFAGAIVDGVLSHVCEVSDVQHWGARYGVDMERAQRAGWEEVDCGSTRNAFWRVPPRPAT